MDGLDLNQEFIAIAAEKNPRGQYFTGDMTDFNLDRTYDIVLCLFSSIGYVRTLENVVKALKCFKNHLNRDGIIVVEPWFTPDGWIPDGRVHMITGTTDEGKICRMNVSLPPQGRITVLNFHYLVGTRDGVKYITERHELGLFTVDEMKQAFNQAGLSVHYDPAGLTGRGLYVARAN